MTSLTLAEIKLLDVGTASPRPPRHQLHPGSCSHRLHRCQHGGRGAGDEKNKKKGRNVAREGKENLRDIQ